MAKRDPSKVENFRQQSGQRFVPTYHNLKIKYEAENLAPGSQGPLILSTSSITQH